MASSSSGAIWYNVPMVDLESYLTLRLRVTALEQICHDLESMILDHRRNLQVHVSRGTDEAEAPAVTETPKELFDANPLYYQTLVDLS